MTVYCPNCGTANADQATECVSCTTKLEARKPERRAFKGTMMMPGGNAFGRPPTEGESAPGDASDAGGGDPFARPPSGGDSEEDIARQKTLLASSARELAATELDQPAVGSSSRPGSTPAGDAGARRQSSRTMIGGFGGPNDPMAAGSSDDPFASPPGGDARPGRSDAPGARSGQSDPFGGGATGSERPESSPAGAEQESQRGFMPTRAQGGFGEAGFEPPAARPRPGGPRR